MIRRGMKKSYIRAYGILSVSPPFQGGVGVVKTAMA